MSDARPADVMYRDTTPAAPQKAPPAVESDRPADLMFKTSPSPQQEGPRVAARSQKATRPADNMYGDQPPPNPQRGKVPPVEVDESATTDRGSSETDRAADAMYERDDAENDEGDAERDPADAAAESAGLIEVLPGFAINAPPGFTEFDQEGLDAVAPMIERGDIKRESVQELVNLHSQRLDECFAQGQVAIMENLTAQHESQTKAWTQETTTDPQIMRYGLDAAKRTARGMLERHFDPGLVRDLKEFGFDRHPGLMRSLLHLSEHIAESRAIRRGLPYQARFQAHWRTR